MPITKILARSGAVFASQERAFRSWLQLVSTPCQNITLFPAKQLTQESKLRDSSSNDPTQLEFSLATRIDFPMKKKGHFFTLPTVLWLPWTLATVGATLDTPVLHWLRCIKRHSLPNFFFFFHHEPCRAFHRVEEILSVAAFVGFNRKRQISILTLDRPQVSCSFCRTEKLPADKADQFWCLPWLKSGGNWVWNNPSGIDAWFGHKLVGCHIYVTQSTRCATSTV